MKLSWTFEPTVDRKIVAHSVWLFETNYIRMCVCVSVIFGGKKSLTITVHFNRSFCTILIWFFFYFITDKCMRFQMSAMNMCDCVYVCVFFFLVVIVLCFGLFFTLRCDFFNLLQTFFCVDCRARLADVALLLVCWVLVLFILFRLCVTIEMSFYFLIASMWKWRLFI